MQELNYFYIANEVEGTIFKIYSWRKLNHLIVVGSFREGLIFPTQAKSELLLQKLDTSLSLV